MADAPPQEESAPDEACAVVPKEIYVGVDFWGSLANISDKQIYSDLNEAIKLMRPWGDRGTIVVFNGTHEMTESFAGKLVICGGAMVRST